VLWNASRCGDGESSCIRSQLAFSYPIYAAALDHALATITGNPGLGHRRPDLSDRHRAFNVEQHVVVYTVSPAWRAWFMSPTNAWSFAFLCALGTLFAYSLWNLAVSGVPLWRGRQAATGESPYRHVRAESHRSPRLPSVKELSNDIGDFYN
jgi:hypothetical protein